MRLLGDSSCQLIYAHFDAFTYIYFCSRYRSCWKHLDNLKGWLLLDIYFFDHYKTLYVQIRKKALILYTEASMRVSLVRFAFDFGTTVEAIEKELLALTNTNQIQV